MSEFAWESFTGAFIGEIEFDFAQPNTPAVVAAEIDGFSRALNDMTAPLAAAREKTIQNVRENFEQEKSPAGEKWQDWAPSYSERALSENVGILRKTEDLFYAATELSAYPIIGDDLWATTNGFPDYWAVHNYGYQHIPQREFLGVSEETQLAVIDIFDGWLDGNLKLVLNPLTGGIQGRSALGRFEALSKFRQTSFEERFRG